MTSSLRSCAKPMIALSGVRSSWLTLARKALLWRFAATSAAFCSCNCAVKSARSMLAAACRAKSWARANSSSVYAEVSRRMKVSAPVARPATISGSTMMCSWIVARSSPKKTERGSSCESLTSTGSRRWTAIARQPLANREGGMRRLQPTVLLSRRGNATGHPRDQGARVSCGHAGRPRLASSAIARAISTSEPS